MMHTQPDRYDHTVKINLEALSRVLEMPIEAVYWPLSAESDGAENPCHYLLLPAEGDIRDLFVKLNRLAHDDFPKNKPVKPADLAQWQEADRRWREVLELFLDVKVDA